MSGNYIYDLRETPKSLPDAPGVYYVRGIVEGLRYTGTAMFYNDGIPTWMIMGGREVAVILWQHLPDWGSATW
jgi:hypothetical protein